MVRDVNNNLNILVARTTTETLISRFVRKERVKAATATRRNTLSLSPQGSCLL